MTRPWVRIAVWCLALLALGTLWHFARRGEPALPWTISGHAMGTTYSVKLVVLPPGAKAADIERGVRQAIEEVDRRMSTYDADSELSRWNDSPSTDWQPVSAETARVVAEAVRLGERTGGALDVTVGPLVELWGFGRGRPLDANEWTQPDAAALADTLKRVDYRRIEARLDPPAVRKSQPDVRVDLSAIAKGFAVDHAAEILDRLGVENYIFEVRGDVRTRGL